MRPQRCSENSNRLFRLPIVSVLEVSCFVFIIFSTLLPCLVYSSAGPTLECGLSYSSSAATCISGFCSAGNGVQLVGEVQICGGTGTADPSISIELKVRHQDTGTLSDHQVLNLTRISPTPSKICVSVISDVVGVIQNEISVVNSMLNDLNIYGGCYR